MEEQEKEPHKLEESIETIYRNENGEPFNGRIDRNKVLDTIKKNVPITAYKLSKILEISYPTIRQIVKEFEFCGLIETKTVLGDNNRAHRLIYLPNGKKITREDLYGE